MPRDVRLVVNVDERIKSRLVDLAQEMGLTVSALCAYILGRYLSDKKTVD